MKRTFNFTSDGLNYILENNNPNEIREPFAISISTLEFDTGKFYEYVFSDIEKKTEIELINLLGEDRMASRVFSTIEDICKGVISKINDKFLE